VEGSQLGFKTTRFFAAFCIEKGKNCIKQSAVKSVSRKTKVDNVINVFYVISIAKEYSHKIQNPNS